MDDNRKLVVLAGVERAEDARLGRRIDRTRALKAISASGARIVHDSGGRFIVIDAPGDADDALRKQLPGAKVVLLKEVNKRFRESEAPLDATESLFLEALEIRSSAKYQEAKTRRPGPGETPQEKELFSNPDGCVQDY